jgi:GNAT superfamily N-acetyltransferase
VVRADEADIGTLSQVIADAFHSLAPSQWLIPDPGARREIFPAYFRILAEHTMAAGVVHTTPDRAAAALWLPAGEDGPSQRIGYAARLSAAAGSWASRFLEFDAALERHHPVGIPHHYLAILAVRPDRQGQGIGTNLLRAYHAMLEDTADGLAYLEASDLRSRRLYLRHGYVDQKPPIRLPGGPLMYRMVRPAAHTALPRRRPPSA